MVQLSAKIISNRKLKSRYGHCVISAPEIARQASPGQFMQVRVENDSDPLLRRPLGIHRVCGSRVELLYEILGPATRILSGRKAGERLDVIGPLGRGFDYVQRSAFSVQRSGVLVAGGMGVAPLTFLAEELTKIKNQKSKIKNIVLIGARTKEQILCEKEFKDLGCSVKIATDDGSAGFNGRVTDLLKHLLSSIDYRLSAIYACGPRPMLKELSRISKRYHVPAQISLEEHMSCGIGACLGCAINTKDGYQRVCKEGPVFEAGSIIWE